MQLYNGPITRREKCFALGILTYVCAVVLICFLLDKGYVPNASADYTYRGMPMFTVPITTDQLPDGHYTVYSPGQDMLAIYHAPGPHGNFIYQVAVRPTEHIFRLRQGDTFRLVAHTIST